MGKHNCAVILACTTVMVIYTTSTYAQSNPPVIQWGKCYGGTGNDIANSIQQTRDGGYIIAGSSSSNNNGDVTGNHGGDDYWVVKLDKNGMIQWEKCYGGSGDDEATSIQQTKDGGYIVAGFSNSTDGDVVENHGGYDYLIIKLDGLGNVQWEHCYGGNEDDLAQNIRQTNDNGYIVAGFSSSDNNGDVTGHHGDTLHSDYWIVKLDSSGNITWEESFGGAISIMLRAFSKRLTMDILLPDIHAPLMVMFREIMVDKITG